jgi:glycogen(starch) synthase
MKILYWTEGYWPAVGGVPRISAALLRSLADRGHECVVFTQHDGSDLPHEERHDGVRIFRFPFWQALAEGDRGLFRRTLDEASAARSDFAPDVVHIGQVGPGTLFQRLTTPSAGAPPVLVTMQQAETLEAVDALSALISGALRDAHWIAYCSEAVRRSYARLESPSRAPQSVIPNALEAPEAPPAPLPWDPPVLLCLGRMVRDKGFDTAVRAFARIAARYPTARMVLAGDGPARADVEQLVREHGLTDRIELTGWVDPARVQDSINQATALLVPSRREAFGLVALEAAQLGRPVIAARVGGLVEVVADGKTGTLVPAERPEAWAAAMEALLSSRERTEAMGRAARERAGQEFGWAQYVERYEALYRRLAQDRQDYQRRLSS